jgi:hypothetical protein
MLHRKRTQELIRKAKLQGQAEKKAELRQLVIDNAWYPEKGMTLAEGYRKLILALDEALG